MREFYVKRLKQMETALSEREAEREELQRELLEAKKDDESKKELQERLQQKDEHIVGLRKKHRQLVDLTAVSSRNHDEITRLQKDVKDMKKKKVDLQKALTRERKDHAAELRRLRKEAVQKEKELNKWKRVSSKRDEEAQRANKMAKARRHELGQLRTKYKDSEKRLRLLTVKRSVMAKAGLDPVIIGRRESKPQNDRKGDVADVQIQTSEASVDADKLRGYFDEKVAEVARKEALADKLAQEWEEHFELTTKREEIEDEASSENADEAAQSLSIQIQFKEDSIRRLATRLGSRTSSTKENSDGVVKSEPFLYDEQFRKICGAGTFRSWLCFQLFVSLGASDPVVPSPRCRNIRLKRHSCKSPFWYDCSGKASDCSPCKNSILAR